MSTKIPLSSATLRIVSELDHFRGAWKSEKLIPAERLSVLGQASPDEILRHVAAVGKPRARVGGIGNFGGTGREILRFLAERGMKDADR